MNSVGTPFYGFFFHEKHSANGFVNIFTDLPTEKYHVYVSVSGITNY